MSSLWKIEGVDARLTKLWSEDGLSAAKIAADLTAFAGVPLTRNAVIGHIHRLGLVKAEPVDAETPEAKPRPPRSLQRRRRPRRHRLFLHCLQSRRRRLLCARPMST